MQQEQLNEVLDTTHLEFCGSLTKRRVKATLRELPERTQQAGVCAVAAEHIADKLLGKHGQRNLADHVGRKRHAQPLVLPLQDADDHSLQQRVLVRETAIDGWPYQKLHRPTISEVGSATCPSRPRSNLERRASFRKKLNFP